MTCKQCNSAAINPHLHGREAGVDLDLCDVCYWRARAALAEAAQAGVKGKAKSLRTAIMKKMVEVHNYTYQQGVDEGLMRRDGLVIMGGQDMEALRLSEELDSLIGELARLAEAAQAPKGWRLVPVEPTLDMLCADLDPEHALGWSCGREPRRNIYRAMLAAAPQPEGQQSPARATGATE